MMRVLLVALALLSVVAALPNEKKVKAKDVVTLKGRLVCGEYLVPQAEIKMFDRDSGRGDDEMGVTTTNRDGAFEMTGSATDPTGIIDPYIIIYHRCRYNTMYNAAASSTNPGFKRRVTFDPENVFKYVKTAKGDQPGKTIDLGTINLELKPTKKEEAWIA